MTPWLDDGDVRLYHGDALETLRELPDESVDCVVTSPPYWGLRDYGTPGQMGLEPTPDLFVQGMVELFREIRRVLAPHGTCWVNLGDSFLDKQLVGAPWRVAFALQADGWWLRSDIIWAKPNPMPESVSDRPKKAHEYIFLLTKQPRYWFDTEAVREQFEARPQQRLTDVRDQPLAAARRAARSVWQIATQPYPQAHFATFPEELARRCILAGCPVRVCRVCGKPSERIVERGESDYARMKAKGVDWREMREHAMEDGKGHDSNRAHIGGTRNENGKAFSYTAAERIDLGWSDCGHNNWRLGTVLDPFIGSGTTCKVARDHQRHSIGIDLSSEYLELAARRLQQLSLLT